MSDKLKGILNRIGMTLLFVALAALIIFVTGKPLVSYVKAVGTMKIIQGAPGIIREGSQGMKPIVEDTDDSEQSEAWRPEMDTQYAVISCEQIAMSAPLFYGDGEYSLENGVGQYAGSAMPGEGKPILIGGHDATFFKPLEEIKEEDIITIHTDRRDFRYRVTGIKIADESDTTAYDLTLDQEVLILYTCYPFGQLVGDRSKRYYVYGELQDITDAE